MILDFFLNSFFQIVKFNGQQPWRPDDQHGPGQPAKKIILNEDIQNKRKKSERDLNKKMQEENTHKEKEKINWYYIELYIHRRARRGPKLR